MDWIPAKYCQSRDISEAVLLLTGPENLLHAVWAGKLVTWTDWTLAETDARVQESTACVFARVDGQARQAGGGKGGLVAHDIENVAP